MFQKYSNFLTELHEHLSASSSAAFLWELAHDQGMRLEEKDYWSFIQSVTISKKTSQKKYHALYDTIQFIQSSPYAVERSVHYAISSAYRRAGINVLELRLNPMRRNRDGAHDLDKIMLAATTGMKKACLEYPVKAGLIIELDRRFSKEQNQILTKKAIDFKKEGVVGLDVSGPDHPGFAVDDFISFYDMARDAGLGLTFHTGEFTPAKEVWEVVEKLSPHRLGHGIRSVDDPKLMKKIREKRITLEVCPTCNVRIGIVKDWNEVKRTVRTLLDHGVQIAVGSDSPEFYGINVRTELDQLLKIGAINRQEQSTIIETTKNVSFIH